MERSLISYEKNHNVNVNYQSFSIVLTKNNALIGVLMHTAYAEIYVDDLWVSENYRHKGYGRLLLQSLEDQYKDKGFNNINLVTSAFQAPDFTENVDTLKSLLGLTGSTQNLPNIFIKYFSNLIKTRELSLNLSSIENILCAMNHLKSLIKYFTCLIIWPYQI